MKTEQPEKSPIEQAGEDLFNYAIDREDIKYLLSLFPEDACIKLSKVDYELQILKIIAVGWHISFHLQDHPYKDSLLPLFWNAVQEFSRNLSETAGLMTGKDIGYFGIIKERLDTYVLSMSQQPEGAEPCQSIGREFARLCGNSQDLFVFMTGTKLFASITSRLTRYFDSLGPARL
ncbi:MAG: hypothetical protein GY874_16320 [Desulfobacteraceae bacterium]|nr:hypothetical protein [Desulfobacteraceae bacterium]